MSPRTRAIVIDDTDNRIQYTGKGWFQDYGSQDPNGNFGPTYLHTAHGTNGNDSFSFSFTGTSIKIIGTNAPTQIPITNGTGNGSTWDPKWECFVDGVSIGATAYFPYQENNWALCDQPQLADGLHVVTVNVTTMGTTFWFDSLQFTPSPGLSYGNGTNVMVFYNTDPAIDYVSGWQPLGGTANFTSKLGSQARFNFTGTSLSWFSFIPTELPHNASSATYSIDDGGPMSFPLVGLPATGTITIYNQLFFSVTNLPAAPHTLVVTYLGSGSVTPLTLDYLYITNVSLPSKSNSSSSSGAGTGAEQNVKSGSGSNPGVIAGGVVGGILGAILLTLLFIWLFRRRSRAVQGTNLDTNGPPQPQTGAVSPFIAAYPNQSGSLHPQSPTAATMGQMGTSQARITPSQSTERFLNINANPSSIEPFGLGSHIHGRSTSGTSSSDFTGSGSGPISGMSGIPLLETQLLPVRKGPVMQAQRPASGPGEVVVLRHEDSGLRGEAVRLDVPPVYTPN